MTYPTPSIPTASADAFAKSMMRRHSRELGANGVVLGMMALTLSDISAAERLNAGAELPAGSCPLPGRAAIGSRATAEAGIGQTMKNFVQRPLWAGVVASVLGLPLQGCNATSSPRGSVPVRPSIGTTRRRASSGRSTYPVGCRTPHAITSSGRWLAASRPSRRWSAGLRSSGNEAP